MVGKINKALAPLVLPLTMLRPDPDNARAHGDASYDGIQTSYSDHGQQKPIVGVTNPDGSVTVVDGNGQLESARRLGWDGLAVVIYDGTLAAARKYAVAINRTAELSTWDADKLAASLRQIAADFGDVGITATGFTLADFTAITMDADKALAGDDGKKSTIGETEEKRRLRDRFLVAPFSILDTRTAEWLGRRNAWLAMGLRSEEGRKEGLAFNVGEFNTDTSVFDPVLCELVYRWFVPKPTATTGVPSVLDPTCGGSVRGVVAAALGLRYVGVDLRMEQVDANGRQWEAVAKGLGRSTISSDERVQPVADELVTDPEAMTPIQYVEATGVWLKRDDLFGTGGVRGGKVRTCLALMRAAGATPGFTTAGSRASPQVNIVAHLAAFLGKPCRVHTPQGAVTPEVDAARAVGAELVQHTPGHNSVIVARSREDAASRGWTDIPFGMECDEAVRQTRKQVASIKDLVLSGEVKRVVVPVGSGMSLCGVLWGLVDHGLVGKVKVLAVTVGSDPGKRIAKYGPSGVDFGLAHSELEYHAPAPTEFYAGVAMDPHYEAKVIPFLQSGDLLWCVGIRATALKSTARVTETVQAPTWVQGDCADLPQSVRQSLYDLVFTCPPYGDLEKYSDLDSDLSNMSQEDFLAAWRKALADCVSRLRDNRFAVLVIGDYRDKKTGAYRNFQGETVAAMQAAGAMLYNEMILVNSAGTLAVRIGPQWPSRKVGRQHQTVLVFFKGDASKIKTEFDELPVSVDTPDTAS